MNYFALSWLPCKEKPWVSNPVFYFHPLIVLTRFEVLLPSPITIFSDHLSQTFSRAIWSHFIVQLRQFYFDYFHFLGHYSILVVFTALKLAQNTCSQQFASSIFLNYNYSYFTSSFPSYLLINSSWPYSLSPATQIYYLSASSPLFSTFISPPNSF